MPLLDERGDQAVAGNHARDDLVAHRLAADPQLRVDAGELALHRAQRVRDGVEVEVGWSQGSTSRQSSARLARRWLEG
jgi:hypothetical protein